MIRRSHLTWTGSVAVGMMVAGLALAAEPTPTPYPVTGGITGGIVGGITPGVAEADVPAYVKTEAELIQVLRSDFTGRVIIRAGATLNMSRLRDLPLKSGVRLIGERGPLGSRPLIYTRTKGFLGNTPVETIGPDMKNLDSFSLLEISANDVVVEGIHFRGSAYGDRDDSQPYVHAIHVVQKPDPDPKKEQGRSVVIADNEFDEWTGAGVSVENTLSYAYGKEAYYEDGNKPTPKWPHLGPNDAGWVRVERNYMHHNARLDGGYGVSVGLGSYATIEYNVFDFNRHAVTADGYSGGYIARFNYALQGGFPYPDNGYFGQHFDVHGIGAGYNGGHAGKYFLIAFNTIRGEQDYGGHAGVGGSTRAAFELRGRPADGAYFQENVVVHDNRYEAIRLKSGGDATLDARFDTTFHFHEANNLYDTDCSMDLATGDFDGDGLTDVFVANGTAWFYSRGGQRPWEFLHASTKRTRELGFADIDNDGRTDVLYRDANGNLGFLKSGVGNLVNFTTAPVTMKELRFGDFDGDGKTDIFFTQYSQWQVWYGRTRAWTPVRGSSQPITELLFGEFDDVRGTDVVGVTDGAWSYSSGAIGYWTPFNAPLRSSFADAVAADFDGNGKTDIAFNDGTRWVFSRDGSSPLTVLRSGDAMTGYPRLKDHLIGQFELDPGAEVVSFEYKQFFQFNYLPTERLVFWRGLPSGDGPGFYTSAYEVLSEQNMR